MLVRLIDCASAGRIDQLRPLTPLEADELEAHYRFVQASLAAHRLYDAPSFRLLVVDNQVLDGLEHGLYGETTLCGIPESAVFVMRHVFHASGRFACPSCAGAARTTN